MWFLLGTYSMAFISLSQIALRSYTFENVAFHVLHERLPHFSFPTLSEWYLSSDKQLRCVFYAQSQSGYAWKPLDSMHNSFQRQKLQCVPEAVFNLEHFWKHSFSNRSCIASFTCVYTHRFCMLKTGNLRNDVIIQVHDNRVT